MEAALQEEQHNAASHAEGSMVLTTMWHIQYEGGKDDRTGAKDSDMASTKQDTENGHVTRKSHHGVHEAGLLSDYHYFGT